MEEEEEEEGEEGEGLGLAKGEEEFFPGEARNGFHVFCRSIN